VLFFLNRLWALLISLRYYIALTGLFGGLAILSFLTLVFMPGPHVDTTRVQLERGASLRSAAANLQASGTLRSGWVFRVYVRLRGQAGRVKAGEFDIAPRASMDAVRRALIAGDVVMHKITIAEGLTSRQIIDQLRAETVLAGPVNLPAEGTLLPETYSVPRGMMRQTLVNKMMAAQQTAMAALWPTRQKGLPVTTPREALILASIVERETGVADERPLVAAAFVNRLKKGMRLQSDPTIIYGLVGGQGPLGRPIRRSEIRRKTAYNTYRINGLPPTPIANPGRASIAAVLNPANSKALYFVADGTGGHVFAETLAAHNRNVRRWRQIEKQRRP
jgi:UPF0755 protein